MGSMEDMPKTTVGCMGATTSRGNIRSPLTIDGNPTASFQEHMRCVVDLEQWDPPFIHINGKMTSEQIEMVTKENRDNAPVTGYYQWVTFVMAIQAAIFYFPHKVAQTTLFSHQSCLWQIWSLAEGGLLESFGTEAKQKVSTESYCTHFSSSSQILLRKRTGHEDMRTMEDVVEKFVKYFKSILHHNNWYFAYFVGCK